MSCLSAGAESIYVFTWGAIYCFCTLCLVLFAAHLSDKSIVVSQQQQKRLSKRVEQEWRFCIYAFGFFATRAAEYVLRVGTQVFCDPITHGDYLVGQLLFFGSQVCLYGVFSQNLLIWSTSLSLKSLSRDSRSKLEMVASVFSWLIWTSLLVLFGACCCVKDAGNRKYINAATNIAIVSVNAVFLLLFLWVWWRLKRDRLLLQTLPLIASERFEFTKKAIKLIVWILCLAGLSFLLYSLILAFDAISLLSKGSYPGHSYNYTDAWSVLYVFRIAEAAPCLLAGYFFLVVYELRERAAPEKAVESPSPDYAITVGKNSSRNSILE